MNTDFWDNDLPVEFGREKYARAELEVFRKYCKELGKSASQLTNQELENYYNIKKTDYKPEIIDEE